MISQVKATMTDDDDEGSVVTLVTSVESVVSVGTVVTAVEQAEFIQVKDEVDQDEVDQGEEEDEVMVVEDYDEDQSGDLKFGGNHLMRAGTWLSSRLVHTVITRSILLSSPFSQLKQRNFQVYKMSGCIKHHPAQVLCSKNAGFWGFCTSLAVQRCEGEQAGCHQGA